MGKKRQRHSWREAKKLCRLNQYGIEMAKALGFGPDALIRAIPDRSQKWKFPVKDWVETLYLERFGHVLGAPVPPAPDPLDEDEIKRIEEEIFWEDYWDRNSDPAPPKKVLKPDKPAQPDIPAGTVPTPYPDYSIWPRVDDPDYGDDVPF